jgi:hypothetical protein
MRKLSFIFFSIFLLSCTKVIDLKLREGEIKYVVEGVITNESVPAKVFLTRSKNFNEDNRFDGVSGAAVQINDNGTGYTLIETQPGIYESATIYGIPGHVYELSVKAGNETFTASCTMPAPVSMDTLYISKGPFGQFVFATVSYTDPPGVNNGYRFVQYVNGVKEPAIFWEDDEFTDGQFVITQLDAGVDEKNDPRNIRSGDEVTIEMYSVDEPVFRYWYTLRAGGGDGNGNTAAPANPVSNIRGGALGYFSAHTVDRRKAIAP